MYVMDPIINLFKHVMADNAEKRDKILKKFDVKLTSDDL